MNDRRRTIGRRALLRGSIALALAPARVRAAAELDRIREAGKAAGLEPFQAVETEAFQGIGDAPKAFMVEALGLCETLAADYRKHFERKGFALTRPAAKLRVILLSSPRAYAAFEKQHDLEKAVGGHYDLTANQQVTFDSRSGGPDATPNALRINTFTLVHETVHQLTFNTGVLDRSHDTPVAISESLATYAETWGPRRTGEIGRTNRLRLDGRRGDRWIPLERLLTEDALFEDEATQLTAYVEAWLLGYYFLKDLGRTPKFRSYLAAVRENPDPGRRIAIASEHLGDLARLDRLLQRSR
ncbi:DUF1570 domain-containing protein [Tundrisphaera sp. TA3]|uniref:DUF1570 domain-containing protein n=1 Tax=Tundrisphaera sp. TA3 TaxID=3435775 RepID=UPI003EB85B28